MNIITRTVSDMQLPSAWVEKLESRKRHSTFWNGICHGTPDAKLITQATSAAGPQVGGLDVHVDKPVGVNLKLCTLRSGAEWLIYSYLACSYHMRKPLIIV